MWTRLSVLTEAQRATLALHKVIHRSAFLFINCIVQILPNAAGSPRQACRFDPETLCLVTSLDIYSLIAPEVTIW